MVQKKLAVFTAAMLTVGGIGLMAHGQAQPADQAGQAQQQQQPAAGQSTGAAAQPSDLSGRATAAGDQAAAMASESEVRQTLAQTAQSVLDKDQIKNISQQFCQRDQDRLKDFKSDQVSMAADQLKQAYKEKYQQDLDLSKNADQVFNSQFFRIGAGGEARTASERIGADATSAQKDAAGVGAAAREGVPAGDAAQATSPQNSGAAGAGAGAGAGAQVAAASAGPMIAVTIPASHDLPDTRLNLVKEGSSWKIDLPESIDAQQLSQRLSDHLQMATQMKDKWPADANEAARAISHHVFVALGSDSGGATGAGATGTGAGTGATGAGSTGTGAGTGGATGAGAGTGTQTQTPGANR
jgi:hypothetical protein